MERFWFWRCICLYSYNSFSFSVHLNNFNALKLFRCIFGCHPKICYFKLRGIARPWTQFWHNEHSLFKDQFEPSHDHYSHHNYLPKSKAYKTMLFWKTINGSTLKNSKANILHAFYVHVSTFHILLSTYGNFCLNLPLMTDIKLILRTITLFSF